MVDALSRTVTGFLGSVYYAVTITAILVGMIAYVVTLRQDVNKLQQYQKDAIVDLIARDKEHPTRSELLLTEEHVANVERRMNDLDLHGTRALADRVLSIEHFTKQQDEILAELHQRLNTEEGRINRINEELPLIVERQRVNTDAIKNLQEHIWSNGGERGPNAPR